jgi:hypothetical protein
MFVGQINSYLLLQSASEIRLENHVMYIDKKAAWIAIGSAAPLVLLASFAWIKAGTDTTFPAYEADHFGDFLYMLGSPLTWIVLGLPYYSGKYLKYSDNWWAIPLIDSLFFLQWIIWSQLVSRMLRRKQMSQGE